MKERERGNIKINSFMGKTLKKILKINTYVQKIA